MHDPYYSLLYEFQVQSGIPSPLVAPNDFDHENENERRERRWDS